MSSVSLGRSKKRSNNQPRRNIDTVAQELLVEMVVRVIKIRHRKARALPADRFLARSFRDL